jgi:hypothetical protein
MIVMVTDIKEQIERLRKQSNVGESSFVKTMDDAADTMERLLAVVGALQAVKAKQQMYEPIDSVDGWMDVERALAALDKDDE